VTHNRKPDVLPVEGASIADALEALAKLDFYLCNTKTDLTGPIRSALERAAAEAEARAWKPFYFDDATPVREGQFCVFMAQGIGGDCAVFADSIVWDAETDAQWNDGSHGFDISDATHFMPLPAPPGRLDTVTDSPVDLDKLETLAKAATPGPWTHKSDINGLSNFVYQGSSMRRRQVARTLKLSDDSDAAFIAALNPSVALAIIAEVRAARARNAFLEEVVVSERKARLGCTDEEARDLGAYLRSGSTPPADEVAGLLADLDMVRGELRDYALEHPSYRALDRIENHLKGKR
jgi:hypothetical protein